MELSRRALSLSIVVFLSTSQGVAFAQATRSADSKADASADARRDAREANKKAIELSRTGDYRGALDSFQKAYDLSPSYIILYNIGRMSQLTEDYARSIRAFERYLADGGTEIDKARRSEVEKELVSLRALAVSIEIAVDVEGAEVFVDDTSVGRSPLARAVLANPGHHRIRAELSDRSPVTKELDASKGARVRIELSFPRPASVATNTPPPKSSAPVPPPRPSYAPFAWVATGVFVAGAVFTGTYALVASSDLEDETYGGPLHRPPDDSAVASKASQVSTLAVITDVLVGAAVVSAGVGLYLTITAPSSAPSTPTGGKPSVQATMGLNHVGLRGSF